MQFFKEKTQQRCSISTVGLVLFLVLHGFGTTRAGKIATQIPNPFQKIPVFIDSDF